MSRSENISPTTFQHLGDLMSKSEIFDKILNTFKVTLQDKPEISLKDFVLEYETLEWFTVNKLLQLAVDDKKCLIVEESQGQGLPECYISRYLVKNLIDNKYLSQITKNDLVLISAAKSDQFEIESLDLAYIDIFYNHRIDTPIVFLTEDECLQKEFNDLCSKYSNMSTYQQFRYVDDKHLEWIGGKNTNMNELRKFQIPNPLHFKEDELFGERYNTNIRIICAEPGMGKSVLMKKLKEKTSPMSWTLLIYARNYVKYFKKEDNSDNFLDEVLREYGENDLDIINVIKSKKQMELIWDGLDEVPEKYLNIVLTIIENTAKTGLKQWVTSRNNLKELLEDRFGVLSLSLTDFNEEQQKDYIKHRLGCTDDELLTIFEKINNNIRLFPYNSILGIPLQIYMLTELFLSEDKYYDLLTKNEIFSIADLYGNFVEEKFKKHYTEKSDMDLDKMEETYEELRDLRIENYKEAAVGTYFEKEILGGLSVNCGKFLKKIKDGKDAVGFITKVGEDCSCEFFHNSYGEYFAALFLSMSCNKSTRIKDMFDEKYNNIRFFFDLLLSKASKAHTAVLYKNYQLLEECEDFDIKDDLGRSPLQVGCTWVSKYPLLTITRKEEETFFIRDFSEWKNKNDFSFQNILKFLTKKCNTDEIDHSFFYKDALLLLPFMTKEDKDKIRTRNPETEAYIPTILSYAVQLNYSALLECFESLPLIVEEVSKKTLFDWAVECESVACLKTIVTDRRYEDLIKNDRERLYKMCLKENCRDILKLVVQNGIDINEEDSKEMTLLNYACEDKNFESIKFFVDNGASLEVVDKNGLMPLHRECKRNSASVVKYLLTCGARLDAEDKNGFTLLYYACQSDSKDIVKYLASNKMINISHSDKNGRMLIRYACQQNSQKILNFLIKKGLKVNTEDENGKLPIHYACEYGSLEALQLLIRHKSKIEAEDDEGLMPVHYACKNNNVDIVECLSDNSEECINIADKTGKYPIHYACENGAYEVVEYLISKNVNVNIHDGNETPLQYAGKNSSLVNLLLKAGAK